MDIIRNGQTVTFRENEHGDLVQESDYLFRAMPIAMPLKNFLLGDRIVVAATNGLAWQAKREFIAAQAVADVAELDDTPRPCESCGVHDAPSLHQCATAQTENVLIEGTEDDAFDMHTAMNEAEIMARVTGSIGATVIHQRREADGTLVETGRETFGNTSTPATHHPRRCYCGRFAPGHAPGLVGRAAYDNSCAGDTSKPHDAATCPACLAGATDFQAR